MKGSHSDRTDLVALAARFVSVGAANFVVTYIVYLCALVFLSAELSYLIAFLLGLAFNLAAKARWVFDSVITPVLWIKYAGYYAAYTALGVAIISALTRVLGVPPAIAPLVSIVGLMPLHFVASRRIFGAHMR